MINALGLAKIIINMVLCHQRDVESIIMNWGLLFISKFWSLLYYFLEIKKAIFDLLYPNQKLNWETK